MARQKASLVGISTIAIAANGSAANAGMLTLTEHTAFGFTDTSLIFKAETFDAPDPRKGHSVLVSNGLNPQDYILTGVRVGFRLDVIAEGFAIDNNPTLVTITSSLGLRDAGGNYGTTVSSNSELIGTFRRIGIQDFDRVPESVPDLSVYDGFGDVDLTASLLTWVRPADVTNAFAEYTGSLDVYYTWQAVPSPGIVTLIGVAGMSTACRRCRWQPNSY